MLVEENFSLKSKNTFGIESIAKKYVEFSKVEELKFFLEKNNFEEEEFLILGEGSNILFTKDFKGIVLKPISKKIEIIKEIDNCSYVYASAGVRWDDFVEFAINNELYGVENLSYIPGCVVASPVQNIGAYGVEVKDVIEKVEVFFLKTQEIVIMTKEQCQFGYRDSIFKRKWRGECCILGVEFKLKKTKEFTLSYGNLHSAFTEKEEISLKTLRKKIVEIRKAKLPEPSEIGNAGSFFKNPLVTQKQVNLLQTKYPDIVFFIVDSNFAKISAAWLIESCGWKGKEIGNVAVHSKQALVLVNKDKKATGKEVYFLAEEIQKSVLNKFDINLEIEVNIY